MNKKIILPALIFSLCGTAAAQDLPGKGISVQAVKSPLAEESFQTELANRALAKLGYDVKPTQEVDYSVAYASVARGDATFLTVDWEPLQSDMYNSAGGSKAFFRAGPYITGAAQGYLIDKKTAEKYHITDISQLKDPKIARLFDDTGDGKASLTGCEAGWSCGKVIDAQIKAYGLSQTVEQDQGSYSAMIANVISRYKAGKPILYYTWTPYWVSYILKPGKDVVWLTVPFSAAPAGQPNTDTRLPNGKNYGFNVNVENILVNKAWADKNPAAKKLFSVMKIPLQDISQQNMSMHNGENTSADVSAQVDGWIKAHQAEFNSWIAAAEKAAKQ
ncbi:glycine betaine/L-proline ABC transporter substrate-binding protein ProX [Tatumella terrea]|uniref:Glycine betaine/L-proline ABC transporter substrate-binding protein ProX n=1 Tax=Tatumella terrea TaxID=419007 RepID=A0ABW1VXL2_9GAMM|nr:glycine betaine/L-proline ABC transporter substrate-binding protein ProX [Tatumella sp. JGM118]